MEPKGADLRVEEDPSVMPTAQLLGLGFVDGHASCVRELVWSYSFGREREEREAKTQA